MSAGTFPAMERETLEREERVEGARASRLRHEAELAAAARATDTSAQDDFLVIPNSAPRVRRQQLLEQAITKFAPDALEAGEFASAFKVAVESRYDNRDIEQVSEAFDKLIAALGKLEKRLGSVGPFEAPPIVHDQFAR